MLPNITLPLWDTQNKMADFANAQFSKHGYAHWLAGCSTGKTLAALKVASQYRRILVITVKSAVTNAWINDIKTKTEGFEVIAPMSGTVAQRQAEIQSKLRDSCSQIVIVNYEAAMRMADAISKMGFDLVIADEIHKLKSHDSKTSKELAIASWNIPLKLGLTGTSWNDRPTDIYGQMRFYAPSWYYSGKKKYLSSQVLGNWYSFFERYVIYYEYEKVKIPTGYKNLDQLGQVINPHIFYLKTEDAIDLPPETHIDIRVEMTSEMKRAYRDMQEDMLTSFGDKLMVADCTLACATRLHQLTSGVWTWTDSKEKPAYELDQGSPKTQAAIDIVESNDEPIVIFTRFKNDVAVLEKALDKIGVSHLKLVGGCYEHDEWSKGKARVLIVNMGAGSTGVNLQRARIGIYYSTGHSASDYEQSLWRIRRNGSDLNQHIVYYHLMVENSIDEEIREAIEAKGDTAALLLKELKNRV